MTAVRARITRVAPELRQTHQYDRDLRGAVPDAIEGVLSRWETHPGGVRGWRSLGATDETIRLCTDRLTV